MILELTPPPCRLWGLSLCDRYWQSIDFAARQSSLNSCQATLTDDGRFVGVISHDDPGVANWLDPAGHTEGTFAVRYLFGEHDRRRLPTRRATARCARADLDDRRLPTPHAAPPRTSNAIDALRRPPRRRHPPRTADDRSNGSSSAPAGAARPCCR